MKVSSIISCCSSECAIRWGGRCLRCWAISLHWALLQPIGTRCSVIQQQRTWVVAWIIVARKASQNQSLYVLNHYFWSNELLVSAYREHNELVVFERFSSAWISTLHFLPTALNLLRSILHAISTRSDPKAIYFQWAGLSSPLVSLPKHGNAWTILIDVFHLLKFLFLMFKNVKHQWNLRRCNKSYFTCSMKNWNLIYYFKIFLFRIRSIP